MKYLLVLLAILTLVGCGMSSGTTKKQSTPALVKTTQDQVTSLDGHQKDLKKQVDTLPDTLPQKSGLNQTTQDIGSDVTNLKKSTGAVAASAQKDSNTIVDQKKELAKNPLKDWLYLISGLLLALGVSGFILTLIMTLPAIIRNLSIGSFVTGVCLGTVAYFLVTIFYVTGGILLSGLIGLGVWYWFHRTVVKMPAVVTVK